jgi:hypothetical protein
METNVFLNPYEQPENKLTYSFLYLLENLSVDAARLLLSRFGVRSVPQEPLAPQLLYGGGVSNPDGSVRVIEDGGERTIFLENRTHRRKLDIHQLRRHIAEHVNRRPRALLLVISADRDDRKKILTISDPRVRFSTWQDMAASLEESGAERNNAISWVCDQPLFR